MQLILVLLILVGIPLLIFFVICVIGSLIFSFFSETRKMPNHNSNHPGITDTTPNGVKDIICPKCKSPYCHFYYHTIESQPTYRTKTRVHLLNPFKPLLEEKIIVEKAPNFTIKKYQCNKCGYIFM